MYWGKYSSEISFLSMCFINQLYFLSLSILTIGIFAYLNYHVPRTRREILEILLKGLQRLEYRGYDSAGKQMLCSLLEHTFVNTP